MLGWKVDKSLRFMYYNKCTGNCTQFPYFLSHTWKRNEYERIDKIYYMLYYNKGVPFINVRGYPLTMED